VRHGRRSIARARRGNIPTGRVAGKIYGKETIWVIRQVIWPGVLGKNREKLETIERQETCEKRDNKDDPRGWRNWRGKIGNMRVDEKRRRRDRQLGWPILRVLGKIFGTRKLKREVVSWLGKTAKLLFIFLFFSFSFLLSWTYYTEGSVGKCHITVTVTSHDVTW